jgi:eukaryotic-like serine/threonine-protein kinase
LFPGWHNPPDECCGQWTTDGRYFVFQSQGQIWVIPEKRGIFNRSIGRPIQLTHSPISLGWPLPSKDGKKVFLAGGITRGELVRWDSKSGQFVPFLSGISVQDVSFSRNGQWVAYVSYPDGTLWRSKLDGSDRLQLSDPPLYAALPRWSPDGRQIVFSAFSAAEPAASFVVSTDGGNPQRLVPGDPQEQIDPNWSPDGNRIIFSGLPPNASAIRVLNVKTHRVSTLPGSEGLFSPRWSPDGRTIAALTADSLKVVLFDFRTQHWSELAQAHLAWYPSWSRDSQYVYFLRFPNHGALFRVRIRDHRVEPVVSLKDFKLAGYWGAWFGLTPDDSPLFLHNTGSRDIYALDWQAP